MCLDVVCWSLARDPRAPGPEEQVDGLLLRGQGEKVNTQSGDRGQINSTAPCKDMDASSVNTYIIMLIRQSHLTNRFLSDFKS